MKVLGIETSCDETAVAVVDSKRNILSNKVFSQLKNHEKYGGVVPEIAARAHLEYLDHMIRDAMEEANISFKELDGVAATCGPGLIGGVMVGMMAGKAISAAHNLPFIAVNHLEAHALTPRLSDDVNFPYLLLLVSGGHTQILVTEDVNKYKRWGTTLDDAAGECFDKAAKLMGIPYPGGPNLETYALNCTSKEEALIKFPLPTPMKGKDNCDFSFSGLKTALRQHVDNLPKGALKKEDVYSLSYCLQNAISDVLSDRCSKAIHKFLAEYKDIEIKPTLVASGGVAANKYIRSSLKNLTNQFEMDFIAPPINLCSDNGAMVAWAGIERLNKKLIDSLDFAAKPRWPLDQEAEPKQGAGVKA
jgi:N6-L-threonylcarbamoyladenine synthase